MMISEALWRNFLGRRHKKSSPDLFFGIAHIRVNLCNSIQIDHTIDRHATAGGTERQCPQMNNVAWLCSPLKTVDLEI